TRLSGLVKTSTQPQEDGALNVFIGRGQPLIIGANAETLATELDPQLSGTLRVTLTAGPSINADVSNFLTGGELGAALIAADELIEPTRRELNLLAAGFAETFNAVQEGGDDLTGTDGVPMFTPVEDIVRTASDVNDNTPNSGNATVTFTVTDVTQLTGDSYELEYTAGGVTLKNLTTNTVTTLGGSPATVDGFEITYDPLVPGAGAGANEGDAFIIDPVFQAARLIEVEIDDPALIAAAADGQAAGNNQNMLAMIELRDQSLLKGGTTSFTDMYSSLVTDVAVRTQRAKTSAETEETLLSSAIERQSSLQGVSLDEEAANLIRFQQAYQAAAQIVAVAGEVFDTLIAATSR
ncbi:MAG: flagellar basal body rod C-terminal domain-containing protein, partial [Luminiphilus sp.]